MELFFFLILSAITLISAINVLIQKTPIYSALSLIVTFIGLAGIYLQMKAEFIAAMQIVVYAGAIMVLFVFVIMLLNAQPERFSSHQAQFVKYCAAPLCSVFFVGISGAILHAVTSETQPPSFLAESDLGTVANIGQLLYTKYSLPLEVASLLLLTAILGVVVLAKKETH
jgi:NADH-quinone oxidoreductase subunit J